MDAKTTQKLKDLSEYLNKAQNLINELLQLSADQGNPQLSKEATQRNSQDVNQSYSRFNQSNAGPQFSKESRKDQGPNLINIFPQTSKVPGNSSTLFSMVSSKSHGMSPNLASNRRPGVPQFSNGSNRSQNIFKPTKERRQSHETPQSFNARSFSSTQSSESAIPLFSLKHHNQPLSMRSPTSNDPIVIEDNENQSLKKTMVKSEPQSHASPPHNTFEHKFNKIMKNLNSSQDMQLNNPTMLPNDLQIPHDDLTIPQNDHQMPPNDRKRPAQGSSDLIGNKFSRQSAKLFSFVLTRFTDFEFSNVVCPSLSEYSVAMRGKVVLLKHSSEAEIREQITKIINERFPLIKSNDLEFLKANRRSIQMCYNGDNIEYNFRELRNIAGQGKLYLKLRNGALSLLDTEIKFPNRTPTVDNCQSTITTCTQLDGDSTPGFQYEELFDTVTDDTLTAMCNIEQGLESCNMLGESSGIQILQCYRQATCSYNKTNNDSLRIYANHWQILDSAFDELDHVLQSKLFCPLSVSYYGEKVKESSGEKQKFLQICMKQIEEKYFNHGLKHNLTKDYEKVAVIISMSILQNGPFPYFIPHDVVDSVFNPPAPKKQSIVAYLQRGFAKLGILQLGVKYPQVFELFKRKAPNVIPRQNLIDLLSPNFTDIGTLKHKFQCAIYDKFLRYVREVSNSSRIGINLNGILSFVTGMEEIPILGFKDEPKIKFVPVSKYHTWHFAPKVDICTQTITLPTGTLEINIPDDEELFSVYDSAFSMKLNY